MLSLAATTSNLMLTGSRAINGTGNNLGNTITGNSAANNLSGGIGADRLIGGGGKDILTGGQDADIFRIDDELSSASQPDTITDFNPIQGDRIELENAVFKGLTRTGQLAPTAFRTGQRFASTSERVLYNPSNGHLSCKATAKTGPAPAVPPQLPSRAAAGTGPGGRPRQPSSTAASRPTIAVL